VSAHSPVIVSAHSTVKRPPPGSQPGAWSRSATGPASHCGLPARLTGSRLPRPGGRSLRDGRRPVWRRPDLCLHRAARGGRANTGRPRRPRPLVYADRDLVPARRTGWDSPMSSGRGEPGRAGGGLRPRFRRPANRVGWLFLVAGQGSGLGGFVNAYGLHALVAAPGSLPACQRVWGCRLGWSRSAVACRMLMTYGARDDTCSSAGGGRTALPAAGPGTCEGRDL
jgi:hypothetical protein